MNSPLREIINANPNATSDQIAAICAADKRTVRPIVLDQLRPLLTTFGVLGVLHVASSTNTGAANAYAYINSANLSIRSDLAQYAPQLDAAMSGLTMLGLTDDQKSQIIALGGGYLFAGIDSAAVDAEKRGIAADALIDQARAWEETAKQATANTAAAFVSQVETWRDTGAGDQPVFNLT